MMQGLPSSLLMLMLILSSSSRAAEIEVTPAALRRADSTNTEEALLSAIVKVEMKGGHCTGTYVSKSGHILLAAHCLDSCIRQSADRNGPECVFKINGEVAPVSVLLASKCTNEDRQAAFKRGLRGEPSDCANEIDLALILPHVGSQHGCLRLDDRELVLGQPLIGFGYAASTFRGENDSDGKSLQKTVGNLIESPTCELTAHRRRPSELLTWTFPHVPSSIKLEAAPLFRELGLKQTSLDMWKGASGGPALSLRNEVIGVFSLAIGSVHNDENECDGAVFIEPVSRLDSALQRYGAKLRKADLGCD